MHAYRRGRDARSRAAALLTILGAWVLAPHRAGAQGVLNRPSVRVAGHEGNPSPQDHTPPRVWIIWPSGGATVSGAITVTADASDDVAVADVQFLLDGQDLGGPARSSPYACAWDTTAASDGSHVLTTVARDTAGNRATSEAITVTVSNWSATDPTRFEETSATMTPIGAWLQTDDADAGVSLSGGQALWTGSAGATATFRFTGTGVRWIGMPCEQCGIAQVRLDGSLVATVDTYAASRPAATLSVFSVDGLAAVSHTLVIEATGTGSPSSSGSIVVVDAYDVLGWIGGGATGHVEEIDSAVSYTGGWEPQHRADLSGGSIVESADPAASATLSFDGTGVDWIGYTAPWAGIADVYVDGVFDRSVDTYTPAEQAQATVYSIRGLPAGRHTLTIKVTFTWNPAAVSAWIVIDAFDVM